MEEKAQISLEMILVLAALVALALLVVSKMQSSATKAGKAVDEYADKLFNEIEEIK